MKASISRTLDIWRVSGDQEYRNVGGTSEDSSMLGLHLRATERFDNRKSEFGLMLSIYSTLASMIKDYPIMEGTGTQEQDEAESEESTADIVNPSKPAPFKNAIAIYGIFATNFLGAVESYDSLRQGLHLGLGGFLASGYVTSLVRAGWDVYFGRRFFSLSISGIYLAPAKIMVNKELIPTRGGGGADIVFSFNY